jgi:hypothetical protein
MCQFSEHAMHNKVEFDSTVKEIPAEEVVENEMEYTPANTLYYEQSGSERYPTFTVHLVMEDREMGEQVFETESEAEQCILSLKHILDEHPSAALQEFYAYSA